MMTTRYVQEVSEPTDKVIENSKEYVLKRKGFA